MRLDPDVSAVVNELLDIHPCKGLSHSEAQRALMDPAGQQRWRMSGLWITNDRIFILFLIQGSSHQIILGPVRVIHHPAVITKAYDTCGAGKHGRAPTDVTLDAGEAVSW
jgi:hypothetical protein